MSYSSRKICLVTPEYLPDQGGTSRAATRLAGFLATAGHDVHVFAPVSERPPADASTDPPTAPVGITLHRVAVGERPREALASAIASADAEVGFDLFHGFFFHYAWSCLSTARRGNRPVIASFRGIDSHRLQTRGGAVELAILEQAAWITSVSTAALLAADAWIDISGRSSFIPNSIDVSRYHAWRVTPENRGVVGTVCTLREKKDIPLLVQAFGRLPAEWQRKLLLVGDYAGPEADAVREKTTRVIARYRLEDKVEITGLVAHDRIPASLLALNVFVVASKHEGLPNALLEAAAAGLPIVATAVDGTKDLFRHEESALLVNPGDPIALGAAIERLLSDSDLAERLSRGARRLAGTLRPETERRAWLDLYDRLIDHDRSMLEPREQSDTREGVLDAPGR